MACNGEYMGFEKFMKLAELAGIPKPTAATLFAREHVPDEYRKYIGCTVAPGRRKTSWKMTKEEFRAESEPIIQEAGRGRPINEIRRITPTQS